MNKKELKKIIKEIEKLLIEKNKMYGDENIIKIGKEGIIIRITEKIERLKYLLKNKKDFEKEPREDSWKDIAGYSIIGLMLERDKWK
ncbi:MAG: hypothetical protein QW117_00030 [Candidatus Pacearchaeota archaeon]